MEERCKENGIPVPDWKEWQYLHKTVKSVDYIYMCFCFVYTFQGFYYWTRIQNRRVLVFVITTKIFQNLSSTI